MRLVDRLTKIGDSFTVEIKDNGFVFAATGRGKDDEWTSANLICTSAGELVDLVNEAVNMPRDQ